MTTRRLVRVRTARMRDSKIETEATSDSGRVGSGGSSQVVRIRTRCAWSPYIKASEQTRGSSMTMRHGEHSATVDPSVRGVIPSFSHRSLRPHSSPATTATPSAAFLPFPLLPSPPFLCYPPPPLSTSIFVFRGSQPLSQPPRAIRLLSISLLSPLYSSGKRRAAMYLPGGTTYVNLSHYILPGWANLNFPLSGSRGTMLGMEKTDAVVNRCYLIFVSFFVLVALYDRRTSELQRTLTMSDVSLRRRRQFARENRDQTGSATQAVVIKANFTLCIRLRSISP